MLSLCHAFPDFLAQYDSICILGGLARLMLASTACEILFPELTPLNGIMQTDMLEGKSGSRLAVLCEEASSLQPHSFNNTHYFLSVFLCVKCSQCVYCGKMFSLFIVVKCSRPPPCYGATRGPSSEERTFLLGFQPPHL